MEIFFINTTFILIESFILAFAITYTSIPSIVKASKQKQVYDVPNGRTSHDKLTPTMGGLSIFMGFVISSMIFVDIKEIIYFQYVIVGLIVIFFLGLKDDVIGLNPTKKFVGQLIAASIVIDLGGVNLSSLYGFMGVYDLDFYSSSFLTLFVVIALINSFNLIDGIDGLAAGVGIITVSTFGIWFYLVGEVQLAIISATLIGALLAFFRYNVFSKKNKLFMGDIGSLIIGFMLSILAIKFNEINASHPSIYINSAPAVSIGILIIPIYDTVRVFTIRMAKGQSPFKPDKRHVHHELLQITGSHSKSTLILLVTNVFFIILSLLLQELRIITMTLILFGLATILSFITFKMAKIKRDKGMKDVKEVL